MQQHTVTSRLGAWLMLFARWPAWAAFVPYAALLIASNYGINAIIARPEQFSATQAGGIFFVIQLGQYLVWSLAVLFLARRLGGDAPRTAWGGWLLFVVLYLVLSQYLPALIAAPILMLLETPGSVAPIASALGLVASFALFPVVVRMAALAHGGNELRLRAIWNYLMREGSGLYTLFIGVAVAVFLLDLLISRQMGTGTADLIALQMFNALRAIALILFYVMAYREIAADRPQPNRAFS